MAEQLFESFELNGSVYLATNDDWWRGQTFIPQETHDLTRVELKLRRQGSLTWITVSLRDTSAGKPIPPDLVSYTWWGAGLPTAWYWMNIPLEYATLEAGTQYAITIRHYGNASNCVHWAGHYWDYVDPYPNGNGLISTNDGVTWNIQTTIDADFREYGILPSSMKIKRIPISSIAKINRIPIANIAKINRISI